MPPWTVQQLRDVQHHRAIHALHQGGTLYIAGSARKAPSMLQRGGETCAEGRRGGTARVAGVLLERSVSLDQHTSEANWELAMHTGGEFE